MNSAAVAHIYKIWKRITDILIFMESNLVISLLGYDKVVCPHDKIYGVLRTVLKP